MTDILVQGCGKGIFEAIGVCVWAGHVHDPERSSLPTWIKTAPIPSLLWGGRGWFNVEEDVAVAGWHMDNTAYCVTGDLL